MSYASVILPRVPKALSYRIEGSLEKYVGIGSLVKVPLGTKVETGCVVGLSKEPPPGPLHLKKVYETLFPHPVLTPDLIELSLWMSRYYGASLGSVFETVVPLIVRQNKQEKIERLFQLVIPTPKISLTGLRQKALLDKIKGNTGLLDFKTLKSWGVSPAAAHALVKKGILKIIKKTAYRGASNTEHSDCEVVSSQPPTLMPEQAEAVEALRRLIKEKSRQPQLLQGVTGSGKTEVYLRLISLVIELGGTALMLLPEVALTPQMIGRLRGRFGNDPQYCVVWHSHLSPGERADAYRAILSGKCKIVVGARSALFSPLKNLRLIILDEEHEMAYKQEESPRYHARDAALKRALLCGALCILGSATPSLESIVKVKTGEMGLQVLTKRIDERPMPVIHIVDLRRSLGKTPWLSTLLKEKITDRLEKKEQILLFLNRRGHSTSFLCQDCGFIARCQACSIAMTYHADIEKLRCHLCGRESPAPLACPECGSKKVRWRGVGTQKIEALLNAIYPKARIARVDSDTTGAKNSLREIFSKFRRGHLDMLVGTQMIAKGLDFPNVTLVGLIDADLSLHQPDFRAAERTFQLLVQVAGRSGRGDRSGEVVIQTFLPHSSTLQYARHADTQGFLQEELAHRQNYGYPPYRHLIQHIFRSPSLEKLNFYCEAWAREIAKNIPEVEVRGPAPAPIERIENLYRYQVWYLCDKVEGVIEKISGLRSTFPLDPTIVDFIDVDATYLS